MQFFAAILEYDQVELVLLSFGKLAFFEQMVDLQSEWNLPLGIFVYHLYKPLTNQFPRLHGKQPRPMNLSFCHFKIRPIFHSTGDLGASAILGSLDFNKYLGKVISYLDPVVPNAFRSEFVRCWHAKTDGSAASTFHDKCDGKGPTVTIIKSGSYIFGGYTDLSWQSEYS